MKKCKLCEIYFQPTKENRSYCKKCTEETKVNCFSCEKVFVVASRYPLLKYQRGESLFCSIACTNTYKAKKTREAKKQTNEKACRKCGKVYLGTVFSKYCDECSLKKCRICNKLYKQEDSNKGYCSFVCYEKSVKLAHQKAVQKKKKLYGSVGFDDVRIRQKAQSAILSRYGVDNVFRLDSVKEKIKQTNLRKYGVEKPTTLDEIKEKAKQTNLRRYGVVNKSQLDEEKKRRKSTIIQKYGKDYIDNLVVFGKKKVTDNEVLEKAKEFFDDYKRTPTPREVSCLVGYSSVSSIHTRIHKLEKLGVDCGGLFSLKSSLLELKVEDFLKENNITYEKHNRKLLYPLEVDFYLPEHKIAIEVNDFCSHSVNDSVFYGKGKKKNYHLEKTLLCKQKGVRLIHLWEHQIRDEKKFQIVKSILLCACKKTKRRVYARDTYVEKVSPLELREFFTQNHIAGYRGGNCAYVLREKNTKEIVMGFVVGDSIFVKNRSKKAGEVIRSVSLLYTVVVGGLRKLWKHFTEDTKYDTIYYYVDNNLFDGNSLQNIYKMEYQKTNLSYKNYFTKDKSLRNRNPRKHKETKALVCLGEVLEIWDAGTQVWKWKR